MDALPKELALLIIGVVLGALASGIVQWKISHDEEDVELRNVAQALYIDISSVEETYNYSLNHTSIDKNHITVNNVHYYDDNGLYFIFNKDISKFDSETSKDLYDFYSFVLDVENKQEELLAINEKLLRKENLTDSERLRAWDIIRTLYAAWKDGVNRAKKVKKELREIYGVKTIVPPTLISYYPPETYSLEGGTMHLTI